MQTRYIYKNKKVMFSHKTVNVNCNLHKSAPDVLHKLVPYILYTSLPLFLF